MTRTERVYYVVVALWSVPGWFMHPVYPVFLRGRGLDAFEVNAILAIFMVGVLLLEVPTGAVADLHGRKRAFLLSCLVRMAAFVAYFFAEGFWACAAAEIVDAVGLTLASGALEAWAVDGMRAEGDERAPDRVFARAEGIVRAALVGGGVACGLIADRFGLAIPWLVAASLFGLAAVLGHVLMYDDRPARAAHGTAARAGLAAAAGGALDAVRRHAVLRVVCLVTACGAFAGMPVGMSWPQELATMAPARYATLGVAWAVLAVAGIAGAALVAPLLRRLARDRLLVAVAVSRAVALALAVRAETVAGVIAALAAYEAGQAASTPVLRAWMNEHVGPALRATVLSVQGMALTFGGSSGLLALGLLARAEGFPASWLASAAVFAAVVAPASALLGRVAFRHQAFQEGPGRC